MGEEGGEKKSAVEKKVLKWEGDDKWETERKRISVNNGSNLGRPTSSLNMIFHECLEIN